MAEYMLLKFDTDGDAAWAMALEELRGHPEVVAIYRAPTVFCECATKEGSAIRRRGWTKGRKWGWWVCDICGSMSKLAHLNIIRSEAFGFNLLDSTIERQKD